MKFKAETIVNRHKAYLENKSLADACRHYVNALFGNEGLVVVDADHSELKKEFVDVIGNDLFEHGPDSLVTKQTEKLEKLGFKRRSSLLGERDTLDLS